MMNRAERLITQVMMPERDRVKRLPFNDWYHKLYKMYNDFGIESDDMDKKYDCMAVLTNQLSLVLVYLDRITDAEKMIDAAIKSFIRVGEKYGSNSIRDNGFQSWVNQGRIYRMHGKYDQASRIFDSVNMDNGTSYLSIGANAVPKESLTGNWANLLRNIYIMDTLKTYVQAKNPKKLEFFINVCQDYNNPSTSAHLIEGRVILEYLKGNTEGAAELAIQFFSDSSPAKKPIIMLKLICLLSQQGMENDAKALAHSLYESNINEVDKLEINGLLFVKNLSDTMTFMGFNEQAKHLCEAILNRNKTVNDEPLEIDTLAAVAKIDGSCKERLSVKLAHTGYNYLRRRYTKGAGSGIDFESVSDLNNRVMCALIES